MLDSRERAALSRAFLATKTQTSAQLVAIARARWEGLGSWRDADVERFLDSLVPSVIAGRQRIANLTSAYIARVGEVDAVGAIDAATLRGVDATEVYWRPAVEMRTALSDGKDFGSALALSADRLGSLVATDMQLSMQHQVAASTSASPVFEGGFRRVLTGSENCAKCYIASTQRYHRGNLLPIHPGCDCGVEPLRPGENVGQVIDPDRLEQTHDWVQGFTGSSDRNARYIDGRSESGDDYRDLLITHEHGEYGPTLAWRSQHFTGERDI